MKPIKIVVAEDDEVWLTGFCNLVLGNDEIEVAACTTYLSKVEILVAELKPDVLVLDIAWPGDKAAGIRLITELNEKYDVPIVAITAYPELVDLAQAAGASPLKKGFKFDQLVEAIRWAAEKHDDTIEIPSADDNTEDLTNREAEVLREVSRGATDKQIALNLSISEGTVKKHVSSILGKLNANNRAEAAVIAFRRGLL